MQFLFYGCPASVSIRAGAKSGRMSAHRVPHALQTNAALEQANFVRPWIGCDLQVMAETVVEAIDLEPGHAGLSHWPG